MVQFVLERPFDQVDQKKNYDLKRKKSVPGKAFGADAMSVDKIMVGYFFLELVNQVGT
jgi:hypothetical protein